MPKVLCGVYIRLKVNVGGNSFTLAREYLETVFWVTEKASTLMQTNEFLRDIVEGGLDVVNWDRK